MLITCLRHATAEPHRLPSEDAGRALIEKGVAQVNRVAEFCLKHELIPGALYSSPLLRARQTAAGLQNELKNCPGLIVVDWLKLGAEPEIIILELKKLQAAAFEDVWLVSHEPDISDLIARLLNAPAASLDIKKASLTRIHVDFSGTRSARLLWSIPCALMK